MSTLFVNTIKPDSGSSILISSSLLISESLTVKGDFNLSGSIKLGDSNTDSTAFGSDISSSIIPDIDEKFNLGTLEKKWGTLHATKIISKGDISSSGTIYASNLIIDDFDLINQTFTSITASGDISTSGAFIGDGSQLSGVGISGSALDVINISSSGNISSIGTGSFEHLVVSGEISGAVSASGTGSFQGGVQASEATSSFGYIIAGTDILSSGTIFASAISSSGVISGSNIVANGNVSSSGTGSFNHFYVSGEVSGSISASGTGSFYGGIVAIDATGSFGYISSSGDVSASGTGSFENLKVQNHTNLLGDITASGTISSSGTIITDTISGGVGQNGLTITGNITASGILSSSGEITTNTLSTTHNGITKLTINTDGVLSSSGDIEVNTGSFFRGDGRLLTNITSSAAVGGANTQVLFNDNGSVGAEAGITYSTGSLTLSGHLIITGTTSSVSASRVSASAGFEADTVSTSSFGYISCSGDFTSSGLGFFKNGIETDVTATGSFGYISCSGNISLSGEINGANGTFTTTVSASLLKGQSVQAQVGNNLGYRFNLNDDSQINGIQYNTIGERAHLQIPSLPVSVTLPFSASATALVGGNLTVGGTSTTAGTTTTNGTLNVASGFQIGGVAMTATAAELNKMDGFGGTTAQLNSLIKTSAAAIEGGKSVDYDEDGAIKFRVPKKTTSVTLTVGDSGTTLMPTADSAQSFTLPNPSESNGVFFNFIAGSAQIHRIISPTNKIQGFILDMSNNITTGDASVGVTRVTNISSITLVNPAVGDNLQLVSDGDNWYVRGYLKDTPTLGTV